MPSSLAMATGATGRRHIPSATKCFLVSASISSGCVTSIFFSLSGFALEDLPFPLVKLLLGFVIDFLGAIHTGVGPAARKGKVFALAGTLRFCLALDRTLACEDAVDEIGRQGVHHRLFFLRELGQFVRCDDVVIFFNST